MMSLFSSFDLYFFKAGFFILVIFMVNIFSWIWKINNLKQIFTFILKLLEEFFLSLKPKSFYKLGILLNFSLFMMIFFLNFLSINPFNFAFTSQVSTIMFFSFLFWLSFMMFMSFRNLKGMIYHFIPEGTPIYLTWFLFMIEFISNCIRPITLMVRLVANILAGHLLMILLASLVMKVSYATPLYFLLNMVEIFVSLIQAYIFVTMITLYLSEIN